MQLSHAIENCTTYLQANRRSPHTVSCYRRGLAGLERFAGDVDISALTPDLLHEFVVSDTVQLKPDGAARSEVTINRAKAALRSFGGWLVDVDLASRNPAGSLSIRRTARKPPAVLFDLERKRLTRAVAARKGDAGVRDRVMLEVLLGTGIRLSELVGLDVSDVDLDGKRIAICAKGNRQESRFINADLRRLLRRYVRQRNQDASESPALFLSNRGTRISKRQVQVRFRLWLQWAGIDRLGLTVHTTRHTFGTRLYRKTRDLVLVGKALGHLTVEATLIYVHQDDEALEDALESL